MALRCETNDPEIRQDILTCFLSECDLEHTYTSRACFEHGQWFVECACGAQWSVNDGELANGDEVFLFEQVSSGDEDFHEDSEPYNMRPNTTVRSEKKYKLGEPGSVYEFDVKFGAELRGVNISDEDLQLETHVAVQTFAGELRKSYPWIGRVFLTGRSGGWLAIEDRAGGATRADIEAINERVDEAHAAFAQAMREGFGAGSAAERGASRSRGGQRRSPPARRLRRNSEGDAIVLEWDEMTKDLGLPSQDSFIESYAEAEADAGHDAYVAARDEALRDDADEEEAERIGEEAREKAWEEFSRDVWSRYEGAVEHAAEITYGHIGLDFTAVGEGKVELTPKKSWEDVAEQLRELINGVGYFEFHSLEAFIESGPYESPKDVVEKHLHWVKDYAAVYGDTSAERLYERHMR